MYQWSGEHAYQSQGFTGKNTKYSQVYAQTDFNSENGPHQKYHPGWDNDGSADRVIGQKTNIFVGP